LRRYKKKRAAEAAPKNTELHHPRVGCGATGVFFMSITADIQPKMFFACLPAGDLSRNLVGIVIKYL